MSKGRGNQSTYQQRFAILTWFEIPANFLRYVGKLSTTFKGTKAGSALSKEGCYKDIADTVNQSCGTDWTPEACKGRVRAYLKLYKDTNSAYKNVNGAKFTLSASDIKVGITTIEKKLDKMCPCYQRMDNLFGGRQNVNPTTITEQCASDDELSSNEGKYFYVKRITLL